MRRWCILKELEITKIKIIIIIVIPTFAILRLCTYQRIKKTRPEINYSNIFFSQEKRKILSFSGLLFNNITFIVV